LENKFGIVDFTPGASRAVGWMRRSEGLFGNNFDL